MLPKMNNIKNTKMVSIPLLCVFLTFGIVNVVDGLANCPSGCQCDDNTLIVQCGEGQLDVLPIALNPSIQRLVIRSNKIKTIDSSIQFYAELTFLDLSSNHLMTIPQRTFAYQKKLREIHLNHNKIGQISNKTFIGLSSATVLNLRGNLISELHQGTFSPLNKIEELNLGENRIGFIDPKAFDGLTQLRILYLDDNALTSVPDPVILQALPSLAELFLGMNTLLQIPSGAFEDVKGLTRLDLKGAGLRNITHDSFKGLEALRILDLSDNRLSRIPTLSLSHLGRLEELTLGQNDFEIIMEGAFVGLKQLKRLDISGALRLKRVMNGAFGTNTNLEYLNLSSNKMLSEVQEGALGGLPHLRHVILKANGLTTLAEGLFPWKDLITLDLSENAIACDCRVMWLRNLLIARNGTTIGGTTSTASSSSSNSNSNSNGNNFDGIADVTCEFPERLRGDQLKNLNPQLMGCTHTDPRKQALIGALLVGSAATITALALIIYRCRRKICEYLKGGIWGNSALGRKEREYQKTFCDEDYMTRHSHHPCSLGIHSTFPNTYTPHHPTAAAHHHYGICGGVGGGTGMGINDLNSVNNENQKNFQQLQVPTGTMLSDKKSLKNNMGTLMIGGNPNAMNSGTHIDDTGSFVLHMKPNCVGASNNGQKQLNHYTKPQFLSSTAAVGDSCYSYADVPIVHAGQHKLNNDGRHHQYHHQQQQQQQQQQQKHNQQLKHQLRLTQDHFNQQLHYGTSQDYHADASSDIMDPNYIYSNAHYSLPLEQIERTKTPTPPPLPPALPLRNGLAAGNLTTTTTTNGGGATQTPGRRSFNTNQKHQLQNSNTNSNSNKIHNNNSNTLHNFH